MASKPLTKVLRKGHLRALLNLTEERRMMDETDEENCQAVLAVREERLATNTPLQVEHLVKVFQAASVINRY
jgi:hypothetical protein